MGRKITVSIRSTSQHRILRAPSTHDLESVPAEAGLHLAEPCGSWGFRSKVGTGRKGPLGPALCDRFPGDTAAAVWTQGVPMEQQLARDKTIVSDV